MVGFNPSIPVGQTVQALLGQAQSLSYGTGQRIPFQFGSTLRELATAVRTSEDAATLDSTLTAFNLAGSEAGEIVSRFGVANAPPVVSALVNPQSIRWDQPKRIARKDTRNGTVFFHFTDENGQDNDILTLELSGTTGNLDRREDILSSPAGTPVAARAKLGVFQNLYALTREPRLIPPRNVNEFFITYQTKAFPAPITFFGFYNKVLTFEESAAKPNSVDWSMSFTVQRSSPPLNEVLQKTFEFIDANTDPQPSSDSSQFEGITST